MQLNSIFFDTIFLKKNTKFLGGGEDFSVNKISNRFPRGNSLLNFLILKLKMLITSYIKAVENF